MHSHLEKMVAVRLYETAYMHAQSGTPDTYSAAAELAQIAGERVDLMTLAAMHLASARGGGDVDVRRRAVQLLTAAGAE